MPRQQPSNYSNGSLWQNQIQAWVIHGIISVIAFTVIFGIIGFFFDENAKKVPLKVVGFVFQMNVYFKDDIEKSDQKIEQLNKDVETNKNLTTERDQKIAELTNQISQKENEKAQILKDVKAGNIKPENINNSGTIIKDINSGRDTIITQKIEQKTPSKKLSFIDLQRKNGVFYISEIDKEVKNEVNSRQTDAWCIGKSNNNGIVSAVLETNCAKQGTSFQIQDTKEPQVLKSDNDECLDYNGLITDAGQDNKPKPVLVFKKCDPNSAKWSIINMDDSIGVFRIKIIHKDAENVCVDLTNGGKTEGNKIQLNTCHELGFYYSLLNGNFDNYWVAAQSWYIK